MSTRVSHSIVVEPARGGTVLVSDGDSRVLLSVADVAAFITALVNEQFHSMRATQGMSALPYLAAHQRIRDGAALLAAQAREAKL